MTQCAHITTSFILACLQLYQPTDSERCEMRSEHTGAILIRLVNVKIIRLQNCIQ